MKRNWLIHVNIGSVKGGIGQYLVVLGQYGARGGRWTSLDASFARCFAIF